MTTAAPERPALDQRHVWRPGPRQAEVLEEIANLPEDHYLFLGYGGAAGGGKTNLNAELAIEIGIQCPGSRTLIGRNHLVDLKTTTLAEFDKVCPPEILHKRYDSVPIYREIRLPHWPADLVSTIFFRGVENAEDHIGSEEYGNVLLEEAHEIAKRDITYLFGRQRHQPEKKYVLLVTFNPFPSFVTDVFIEGTEQLINPDEDPELAAVVHIKFIPAKVFDNPYLPKNYASALKVLYGNDPYYLAVLLNGEGGAVPNSVYGEWLNDPVFVQKLQIAERPKGLRFTRAVMAFDWGTTIAHKAAGAFGAVDSTGRPWTLDSWESPLGSSNELISVAEGWLQWCIAEEIPVTAVYDKSQGSLEDELGAIISQVVSGVRDVEGRIRTGRGLISTMQALFAWWRPGAREAWRYLKLYHRDDEGRIVEVLDDIVDAWHYMIYELMHPSVAASRGVTTQAVGYKSAPQASAARSSLIRIRRRGR
ncbi:MAG: phage terminase large subunit [Reyranella sp.]